MSGILYTVATPIGNLGDISSRAIKTLEKSDYILCEDTRVSSKLLSYLNLNKKLIPYHKFNEKEQLNRIVNDLKTGTNIALISDAGTPCISDPGRVLVNELYAQNIKISPISGPCAVSTFLCAIPKSDEPYTFIGFIPRQKSEQKAVFEQYSNSDLVFYESPNRILKTLENISELISPDAKIAIGRELTKLYEEFLVDTAQNLILHFKSKPPKGEMVVMLYKKETDKSNPIDEEIVNKIKTLIQKGFSTKDISVIFSTLYGLKKNDLYSIAENLQN